jgi:hypothetical protein
MSLRRPRSIILEDNDKMNLNIIRLQNWLWTGINGQLNVRMVVTLRMYKVARKSVKLKWGLVLTGICRTVS